MAKKRSRSPACIDINPPDLSSESVSDIQEKNSDDDESSEEDMCFEDYIEDREPVQKKRELLLYIAPLLRKGCYTLQEIA
jgi:hypothetical protein